MSVNDVLQERGFCGFFDIDSLKEITQESLVAHVLESCCVVVFLNDETVQSPWVVLELRAAAHAGIPIIPVIDQDRFSKDELIKWHLANGFQHVFKEQAIGYTQQHRHAALDSIAAAILRAVDAQGPSDSLPPRPVLGSLPAKPEPPPAHQHHQRRGGGSAGWLATVPVGVPELPAGMQGRDDLVASLKASVLRRSARDASATTVAFAATAAATVTAATTATTTAAVAAATTTITSSASASAVAAHRSGSLGEATTAAVGMGGVGKTTLAAAVLRDTEVRAHFDVLCWASLGLAPDVLSVISLLHTQLTGAPLPETIQQPDAAAHALREAARSHRVLLVLDDIWDATLLAQLHFIDAAHGSALLTTSRLRDLVPGAAQIPCELMSQPEALAVLLRAGGADAATLATPPEAAFEAIELCGRLPLTLAIAGSMIRELGTAWRTELVPLLRDDRVWQEDCIDATDGRSVEERVVDVCLRMVDEKSAAGVGALFVVYAVFQEDAIVPAAVVDALGPLVRKTMAITAPGASTRRLDKQPSAAGQRRAVRQWLLLLQRASILRGEIDRGFAVHDLVREIMVSRCEALDGGMARMQRQATALILDAIDAEVKAAEGSTSPGGQPSSSSSSRGGGDASRPATPVLDYAQYALRYHVSCCVTPTVPIHADPLLMRILTYPRVGVVEQAVRGLGRETLRAAAGESEAAGEWLATAQLCWAMASGRVQNAGSDLVRAHRALERLIAAGAETEETRALEARVLGPMAIYATQGGYVFGSAEHSMVIERLKTLGEAAGKGDIERLQASCQAALARAVTVLGVVGGKPEYVHLSEDNSAVMVEAQRAVVAAAMHAAAAAPAEFAFIFWQAAAVWLGCFSVCFAQRVWVAELEQTCAHLPLQLSQTYEFARIHPIAKSVQGRDPYLYASNELWLLLRRGHLRAAREGWAKHLKAWESIGASVASGASSWDSYFYEKDIFSSKLLPAGMLAAGEAGMIAAYVEHAGIDLMLRDECVRSTFEKPYANSSNALTGWCIDGQGFMRWEGTHLHMRMLHAYACVDPPSPPEAPPGGEPEVEAAPAVAGASELGRWLPPAAELLRISARETCWSRLTCGAAHVGLLGAMLHGERLGDWDTAAEVATGVLQIPCIAFNALVRIEAHRLLGRSHASNGRTRAALEAGERAVAVAAEVEFVWMELLATLDMLCWAQASGDASMMAEEAAAYRTRLAEVVRRVQATPDELASLPVWSSCMDPPEHAPDDV